MNAVKCKICGHSSIAPFLECLDFEFRRHSIRLVQCQQCGFVFVDPVPKPRELAQYYAGNYYRKPSFFFTFIQKTRQRNFSRLQPGKVLDVGCGTGAFLEAMQKKGWRCSGTEFSESSRQFLQPLEKKGIHIQYGELSRLKFPSRSFDLVTLWHVAEHLSNPKPEIVQVHELLKKGGVLFMAIPNIDSASFHFFKCNWFHLDLPRHLLQFSPRVLSAFLAENGFEVKRISHYALEYNPYGVLQSLYNSLGFEFNLLTRKIKSEKGAKNASSVVQQILVIILLPLLLPLSFLFAYLFSFFGHGDTIQVWAEKQ